MTRKDRCGRTTHMQAGIGAARRVPIRFDLSIAVRTERHPCLDSVRLQPSGLLLFRQK
ncbi:MAG: hypothetical protein OJF55_001341 [Rhodanobacteraceae bacterium]|nr:MAG: hypothetical protein OJF55_001341 [Rhodanobacteraceae bacterium]